MNVVPPFPLVTDIRTAANAIALEWHEVLAAAGFIRPDTQHADVLLLKLAQQALDLLFAEEADPERARAIGATLASLCQERPQALASTQALLAPRLLDLLPPEHRAALHPRLADLLGDLAIGYLEAQARAARTISRSLLSSVGHDLHSSLNIVIGFSRMVLKGLSGPLTDLQKSDITAVYNAGQTLQERIDTVLDIAKLETGAMEVKEEPLEVSAILEKLASSFRPVARQNDSTLLVEYGLYPGTMEVDELLLYEALKLLVDNAVRFTLRGTIRLFATRELDDGGDWVRFEVADSGIGMTPARLQNVLPDSGSPYDSTNKGPSGNLWISRRLCQLMGGTFSATSAVGRGSTFTLRLPASQPPAS